jgi:uncharacterized protein YndB with AHSA1/START domain
MTRLLARFGVLAVMLLASWPASAEVVDRAATGFTVRVVADIAASPAVVFAALTRDIGRWWDKDHTYSGDAGNLSLDARPGGCFCERLPGGGGVEHAVVVNLQPPGLLRMRGALGPLQGLGVAGSLTWQIEAAGTGSRLTFTQVAGGYAAGGLGALADAVDAVLARQVALLKSHVEGGGRR